MRIGIITLHKVLNFGSALQAYALQHFLEKQGYTETELIDYKYPNKFHKGKFKLDKPTIRIFLGTFKDFIFNKRRDTNRRFRDFYKEYFNLSPREYKSIEQIEKDPPLYDLYITGSDQVWNVNTLKNDPVMYCSFAPQNAEIISFGSSFTNKTLPVKYQEDVKRRLKRYKKIGVREQSSIEILIDLGLTSHKEVMVTCDPTLLLTKEDYHELALKSELKIEDDFILVYGLTYAYNPEPALSSIVDNVARQLNCKVYTLWFRHPHFKSEHKEIWGIGPCEFCYLFEHAKFIITSSFHGTMFSVINRKPFVSIVPRKNEKDTRIKDFLDKVGLKQNYVFADSTDYQLNMENVYNNSVEDNISSIISESIDFLLSALK